MKNLILELLRRQPKQRFNGSQIASHLKLGSPDFKELRRTLKELVSGGKIILHPGERYSNRDELKVVKGTLRINPKGYGFLIPDNKGKSDVFVPARFINFAMSGDTVLVESSRGSREGLFEGRVVQILEHAHQILVGVVKRQGKQFFVHTTDPGYELDVYIPKKSIGLATDGQWVAIRLVQYPGPGIVAIGEVEKVLGDEISDHTLTDATLLKFKITRPFPQVVNDETRHFDEDVQITTEGHRHDLSALPIITIDGITARDFDDAVCVIKKNNAFVLYVSIADVSHYVKIGSALDQEAYQRATSVYLPNECIPMLPEKLSNGLCSLVPHVPRLTMTCEMHFNDNADFTHARYYNSVIVSKRRCTYNEVQAFIDGEPVSDLSDDVKKSLANMKILADKLVKKTTERGALGFDLPEAEIRYDANGSIIAVTKAQRFFSNKLIEVFMVAANVAVAQVFSVNGLPQIYRVHDAPDAVKLQNFMELVHNLRLGHLLKGFNPSTFFSDMNGHKLDDFLKTVFLRSLKQAAYDAENIGHYGLSLKDYCHFTSPIRRYPDLLVHRQLKALLKESPEGVAQLKKTDFDKKQKNKIIRLPYTFQDLKVLGGHCSKRERDAMEAEREVMGVRRALFIKRHLHDKFFGRITRVAKLGLTIELEPHFVEGFLHVAKMGTDYFEYDEKRLRMVGRKTRAAFGIGDRIWVTVAHVKPEVAEVELMAIAEGGSPVGRVPAHQRPKQKRHARRR